MELAQYARDVIPHLKEIDKGYPLFWHNPNKVSGFRLTQRGYSILIERQYKSYYFYVTKLSNTDMILMDQKMTHPWYLSGFSALTVFHEPLAIAMALSNNNIDTAINLVYC